MDKIKSLKVKQADGTFAEAIPFGANAENIDMADGSNLETKISSIVSDFENYYNKESIDSMLGAISSLDIQIVDTLPTEDISTSTIYLKPSTNSETENVYDEFIYTNGNWEQIGSTAMDLSGYVTDDELVVQVETEVTNYFTEHKDELMGESGVYIGTEEPTSEIVDVWIDPSAEGDKIPTKVSELENDANYATTTYVDEAVKGLVGSESVERIEAVTSYPSNPEEGVLYIQVGE